MSYSLKLLIGGCIGDYIRDYYGVIKGDTRSLGHRSPEVQIVASSQLF